MCVILGVSSSVRSPCRGLRIESLLSLFCVFLCYDFYYYCAIFPVVGFGAGIGIWYFGAIGVGNAFGLAMYGSTGEIVPMDQS